MKRNIIDMNALEAVISLDDSTTYNIPSHSINSSIGDKINIDINNINKCINNGHNSPLCSKLIDYF